MGLWRRHLLAMDTRWLHLDLRLLSVVKEGLVVQPLSDPRWTKGQLRAVGDGASSSNNASIRSPSANV